MRFVAQTVGFFLCATCAAQDPPQLKVRNSSGADIQFYFRSVAQGTFGPPAKVPKGGGVVSVPIAGEDSFLAQLDLGEAGWVYPDDPIPLKMMAKSGVVYDLGVAFEVIVKDGRKHTVGTAWLGPNEKKDIVLKSASPELQKLTTSSWASEFKTAGGQSVVAAITLNKDHGTFKTDAFEGKLFDIRCSPNKGDFELQGRWEAQKAKGVFIWKVSKDAPTKFTGEWRTDDSKDWHPWNGTVKDAPAKKPK